MVVATVRVGKEAWVSAVNEDGGRNPKPNLSAASEFSGRNPSKVRDLELRGCQS